VLDLAPPFTSARYLEAMEAAAADGYDVLVIDSLSHQWNGEGGILARKEELDRRPGANSYTNWARFTKEHTEFLSAILQLPVHVIVTLRAKQDYVVEQNDRGKSTPKKVGMAPVQREGLEYEFSTVFELQMDHKAAASKDRTSLFADHLVDLMNPRLGAMLRDWLASGAPLAPSTPRHTTAQAEGAIEAVPSTTSAATPNPAAASEESPPATEHQINTILELCDHTAIAEQLAEAIRMRLKKGVTTARADQILVGLETEIRKATPAPLPPKPEPSVAELNQAAEAASARVHAMTQRLNALLTSDRVVQDVQSIVRQRLAKSELTEDVLEQAIAELENVEIPF
jgi:hypothetical protein